MLFEDAMRKMCNCEASFLDEPKKMREIPLLTHMGNKIRMCRAKSSSFLGEKIVGKSF